jgi:branched-chain amino acid transport system permease protein
VKFDLARYRSARARGGAAGILIVVAALVPTFVSGFDLFSLALVALYVTAAVGLNLASGYAGELLLGQATVMGVAAFTAGAISLHLNWPIWLTLPVAIVAGIGWQLIISVAGLRIRGLYLGIISFFAVLAFAEIALLIPSVTGGSIGLNGLPQLSSSDTVTYEICLAILILSLLYAAVIVRSGWGLRLRMLRDAPRALQTIGSSIEATKLFVYVAAAIPAAVAGWALTFVDQDVTSSLFGLQLSLILFAGVELVGPGTLIGPVIGAGALEIWSQVINPFSDSNTIGLGIFLWLAVVLFSRTGTGNQRAVFSMVQGRLRTRRTQGPDDEWVPEARPERASLPQLPGRPAGPARSSGGLALEVTEVRKAFGGNQALRGTTFGVRQSTICALMGENGSGKTTTLNIISGLIKMDSGQVTVLGKSATGLAPHQVARMGLGRTFQVPQLVTDATVRDNIEIGLLRREPAPLGRAILGPRSHAGRLRRRRAEADAVCDQLGLSQSLRSAPFSAMPLGMRRLVEVGRALAAGSELICLDEPTAGLNDSELEDLGDLLRKLRDSGTTVLIVEHTVRFVLDYCDDIVLMSRGAVQETYRDFGQRELSPELASYLGTVPDEDYPR